MIEMRFSQRYRNHNREPEILELKNSMNKVKYVIKRIWSKAEQRVERISEIEGRGFEIIQLEEKKRKKNEKG